jgi:hypothetical protein
MKNIHPVQNKILNADYVVERNSFWDSKVVEFNKAGQPLWNGAVYYLDNIDGDSLSMGLCEYKDILFSEIIGVDNIIQKYGSNNNFVYMNVQILIKLDDKYIFGTKKKKGHTEIISVGGTMRLEDGKEIKSFNDIKKYAKKEVDIETNLNINIDEINNPGAEPLGMLAVA